VISKAVFVLQVTWFLTQYITHYIERLAITQLEVGTLASAVLNIITCCLKLLNVQHPHRVYFKDEVQEPCNIKYVEQRQIRRFSLTN